LCILVGFQRVFILQKANPAWCACADCGFCGDLLALRASHTALWLGAGVQSITHLDIPGRTPMVLLLPGLPDVHNDVGTALVQIYWLKLAGAESHRFRTTALGSAASKQAFIKRKLNLLGRSVTKDKVCETVNSGTN